MRMFTTRTMIARTRNSGAEDARAPDASRAAWTVAGRVSVWSACDFSAALGPDRFAEMATRTIQQKFPFFETQP